MADANKWMFLVSGAIAGAVVTGAVVATTSLLSNYIQQRTLVDIARFGEDPEDGVQTKRNKKALSAKFNELHKLLDSGKSLEARRRRGGAHRSIDSNVDSDSKTSKLSDDEPELAHPRPHFRLKSPSRGERKVDCIAEQDDCSAVQTSPPSATTVGQIPSFSKSREWIQNRYSQAKACNPSAKLDRDAELEADDETEVAQNRGVTICSAENIMSPARPRQATWPSQKSSKPVENGSKLVKFALEQDFGSSLKDAEDGEASGMDDGNDGMEETDVEGETDVDGEEHLARVPKSHTGTGQALHMLAASKVEEIKTENFGYGPADRASRLGIEMARMQRPLEEKDDGLNDVLHYAKLETLSDQELNNEGLEVCELLEEALRMRQKYVFVAEGTVADKVPSDGFGLTPLQTTLTVESVFENDPEVPIEATDHAFEMLDGVMHVYDNAHKKNLLMQPPRTSTEFFRDMHWLLKVTASGPVKTLCHHRLLLLQQKFNLHTMLNADAEFIAQKSAPHRDFYNVRKVDTHVHHSACMNQKHLLRFIKSKLRKEPDEVVIYRDGKYLTLKEVFESLNLTSHDLNVDTLDMHADKNTFHRFDKFNLKYNPCGQSRLREVFMKQDNLIQGRFLAELTKEVFTDLELQKYTHAEYRISIYGRKREEWDGLAGWICNNRLFTAQNVWLIQLPRLFPIYKKQGTMHNFQEMLDNIFIPLFEVTRDPASHPQLHLLLKQVVGIDMVDDESRPERRPTKHMPTPKQWDMEYNPAYGYYAYYVWANLFTLNKFRESKGMNPLFFRPHSGEAGDIDHLACTYLVANSIAHGNNLRKSPGLQYLYYLTQIGLAMSPLSNNSLFLDYHRSPFPTFFSRGMNVSLSTDDPLQIHLTKEPLVEEYSIAAQVWKLTACDLCEIARNSVLQSGFPHADKKHWVADEYWKGGPAGNDMRKTNLPNIRMQFRADVLKCEHDLVLQGAAQWRNSHKNPKA